MDPRTESIKQEVEETLEDMAAKMEQIEERVVGTARETVEHVKEKLDVRHMVAERPWTMLGVSVAAGFVVGSIRRSGGRDEDSDGRALSAGSWGERSRAFQYEHSEDPYENVDEEFGPSLFQGGGEVVRQGLTEEPTRRGGEQYSERMAHRGQSYAPERYAPERPHRSRQLVQRSISQVKQRAPGILAALRENFGDEIEALKRAVVVAAGNSLRGILQSKLPQIAEEFDRARGGGQPQVESGWRGEQRQQTRQGQGSAGQGYQAQGNQGYQASEGRYGNESRYGAEGRQGTESRYGSEGRQGTESRYGAEGRGGSQGQPMSSSPESEGGTRNRGNEPFGPEGGPGPTGRKSHN